MADLSILTSFLSKLPVLHKDKNVSVAAILGFLFGGIGLGLYTWSLLDFAICILVAIIAGAILHVGGVLVGAAFAGVYGVLRVIDSNKRRADEKAAEVKRQQPPEA